MLDIFPLNIFPAGSLASSVVTTVWVGVAVVVFFNLRFGWVLSGLVVPGYMVPMLILKPWSAAVVFFEGIITYYIVWLLFEKVSRLGGWASVFGRDRFFALVLVSVAVRIGFDGWLWPGFGAWINDYFGWDFDYRNNLQSFGLIVIALIANQYWKTGVLRGLVPTIVIIGVSYLIVRFVLMPFTNFTISNVGYMYEDIASSILASPKAYIILLCAAFVASRMNLLYGWDFSGILIPSLLALQWYQPVKILASFAEAFVILGIAHLLLSTSIFKNANIEGARKLLLFFNIGFVYKFLLGYFVLWFFPEIKITDTYAFGYLLATLLALKMHDKGIAARMTRATLQTSLSGVIIASIVGFGLTLLPLGPSVPTLVGQTEENVIVRSDLSLIERLQQDKVRFYSTVGSPQPVALPQELEIFSEAMVQLQNYRFTKDVIHLDNAMLQLSQIGYTIENIRDDYLYITEKNNVRGWGSYVLNLHRTKGLLVSVPQPLEERGSMEAAEVLFITSKAQAFAVAGSRSDTNPDQSASVLLNTQTVFHIFHRSLARNDVVQVRSYSAKLSRVIEGVKTGSQLPDFDSLPSRLWVKGSLPESIDLPFIKKRAENFEIEWNESPFNNRQRDVVREGFAELLLNDSALRKIRAYKMLASTNPGIEVQDKRIDGYLLEWLLSGKQDIAASRSDKYIVPTQEQLLFFDEEIVTPLVKVVKREYQQGQWSDVGKSDLHLISEAAAVMGYRLLEYRHRESQQDFIVLYENAFKDGQQVERKYWGTYVFRLGDANGYMVQVPRPLYDVNSFEYAVALYERLDAFILSIAGTSPEANRDGSADLVRSKNMRSIFSLVNQVVLRESGEVPMMVLHSRARGYRDDVPAVNEDVLLSFKKGLGVEGGNDALSNMFIETLQSDGLSVRYVDGSPETAGYEVQGVPQSRYLAAVKNKQFWALWLSSSARSEYRQQSENKLEIGRFVALGIPTIEENLYQYLNQHDFNSETLEPPKNLIEDVRNYLATQNVIDLRNIQRQWGVFTLQRLVDRDSQQSFLLVLNNKEKVMLVVNLNPRDLKTQVKVDSGKLSRELISDYINQRVAWLIKASAQ